MRKIHDDIRALCYEVIFRIGGYVTFGAFNSGFETKKDGCYGLLDRLTSGFDRLRGYHGPSGESGEAQTSW